MRLAGKKGASGFQIAETDRICYSIVRKPNNTMTEAIAMNSRVSAFERGKRIVIILLATTVMLVADIDITKSIVIALSCVSNVGPDLSLEIGPTLTWGELPVYIKWTCTCLMLVGRLEIMSVLVLFTRTFWKDS